MTLRIWEPDAPQPSGAGKYRGALAEGYDAKREQSAKWQVEQRVVQDMLMDLQPGSIVLDVPIGTGRFLPFYAERGLECWGVDTSEDMLKLAADKAQPGQKVRLGLGDVRTLSFGSLGGQVDVAVMCRLTRWLSPEDCVTAIRRLMFLSRKRVIFTTRVSDHPHARPLALYADVLIENHWRIARDEPGYEEPYRIVALEPINIQTTA